MGARVDVYGQTDKRKLARQINVKKTAFGKVAHANAGATETKRLTNY